MSVKWGSKSSIIPDSRLLLWRYEDQLRSHICWIFISTQILAIISWHRDNLYLNLIISKEMVDLEYIFVTNDVGSWWSPLNFFQLVISHPFKKFIQKFCQGQFPTPLILSYPVDRVYLLCGNKDFFLPPLRFFVVPQRLLSWFNVCVLLNFLRH